jgi:hypothetical protein
MFLQEKWLADKRPLGRQQIQKNLRHVPVNDNILYAFDVEFAGEVLFRIVLNIQIQIENYLLIKLNTMKQTDRLKK